MSTLTSFYMAAPINKYILVFITWLFWPGILFIVGLIGESRLIPIGKLQSKAFMPGDLSFGVIFVALISMYQPNESFNRQICCILFVPVLYFAWSMRRGDVVFYPPRARISPTKITHDFIGYFIIPLVLLTLATAKIYTIIIHKNSFMEFLPSWMTVLSAFFFYLICVAIDNEEPAMSKQIHARHPHNWKPIWKSFPR